MRLTSLLLCCSIALSVACTSEPPSSTSNASKTAGDAQTDSTSAQSGTDARMQPVPPSQLDADQVQAGWIQLFDGQSLFGWKPNNDVNWSVAEGVIQADSGPAGLLLTTVPFQDYELRCDFRLQSGGNSGIFLRTTFAPEDPSQDCYELNICDSHPAFPTGSIVGRKKVEQTVKGEDDWKTYSIRVQGATITVELDGMQVMQFTDNAEFPLNNNSDIPQPAKSDSPAQPLKSGLIGLQKNEGKVEFRNIWLRPLGLQPLFNGQDLTGWRKVAGSKSVFAVDDGTIHISNGPGFLETNEVFDDFVLQFEAKTNGALLNSGVFFRTLPGSESAPSKAYEFQIHNGFQNGKPSQPVDAGTGAIFRRTQARWVLAEDRAWFTATLISSGSRFATWVNGLQVTDWTDTREPNQNPRRGSRLEAGHISLQGHDPTTDLHFRNLRLKPLPH